MICCTLTSNKVHPFWQHFSKERKMFFCKRTFFLDLHYILCSKGKWNRMEAARVNEKGGELKMRQLQLNVNVTCTINDYLFKDQIVLWLCEALLGF